MNCYILFRNVTSKNIIFIIAFNLIYMSHIYFHRYITSEIKVKNNLSYTLTDIDAQQRSGITTLICNT